MKSQRGIPLIHVFGYAILGGLLHFIAMLLLGVVLFTFVPQLETTPQGYFDKVWPGSIGCTIGLVIILGVAKYLDHKDLL